MNAVFGWATVSILSASLGDAVPWYIYAAISIAGVGYIVVNLAGMAIDATPWMKLRRRAEMQPIVEMYESIWKLQLAAPLTEEYDNKE